MTEISGLCTMKDSEKDEIQEQLSAKNKDSEIKELVNKFNSVKAKPLSSERGEEETKSRKPIRPPKMHVKNESDAAETKDVKVFDYKSQQKNILRDLNLEKYFPNKISRIQITELSEISIELRTIKDIPWFLLEKLLMTDFRVRDGLCRDIASQKDDSGDLLNINALRKRVNHKSFEKEYHPLDIFLTIFLCCDPLLQQTLAKRMAVCQLAVPFVVPFNNDYIVKLWPLEATTIAWRDESDVASEAFLPRHSMNTISFLRLGRPHLSKSTIMSMLIMEKNHHVFVNKECPDGKNAKSISLGTIELAYFLPSHKKSDNFSKEILLFNLRGDCKEHSKQAELLKKSSIIVTMIDIEELHSRRSTDELRNMISAPAYVIILLSCKECPGEDFFQESLNKLEKIIARSKNIGIILTFKPGEGVNQLTDINFELHRTVKNLLRKKIQTYSLEDYAMRAKQLHMKVDEVEFKDCQAAKQSAKRIISLIDSNKDIKSVGTQQRSWKSNIVPLQGEVWHKLSKLQKEIHKCRDSDEDRQREHILRMDSALDKAWGELYSSSRAITPAMREFTKSLKSFSETEILFFLQWLKIEMDNISRKWLPDLQSKYNKLYAEITKGSMNRASLEEKTTQLRDLEKEKDEYSFGLEHFFRELGLLYEATHKTEKTWHHLPNLIVTLLFHGFPFEIMDGDAGGVPMEWVKAVFQQLCQLKTKQNVFVLSVIGIQSSGKSTLLNTMFGLEFAVSAGRCTRGIYAQLLKVNDKSQIPCKYVLILDSEGLRAPELAQKNYQHDNELATLVIGLADLTLVNLKGENTAEMKDVLQIAVQAFLRKKTTNKRKKQRCIFVHQNVNALNAKEQMKTGQHKLEDELNDMTKEAAQAENIPRITKFAHVIEFHSDEHIWHFSDLWSGDPPMAPINTGYSESAYNVKMQFLRNLIREKPFMLQMPHFIENFEEMWEAVLTDNFILTFKNSIAIKAHLSLEKQYNSLLHALNDETNQFMIDNGIENLINISTKIEELEENVNSAIAHISNFIEKNSKIKRQQLVEFFENNDYPHILGELQGEKIGQFGNDIGNTKTHFISHIRSIQEQCQLSLKQKSNEEDHRAKLWRETEHLANELIRNKQKNNLSKDQLKRRFEELWKTLNPEKPNEMQALSSKAIQKIIHGTLFDTFGSEVHDKFLKPYIYILGTSIPCVERLEGTVESKMITSELFTQKQTEQVLSESTVEEPHSDPGLFTRGLEIGAKGWEKGLTLLGINKVESLTNPFPPEQEVAIIMNAMFAQLDIFLQKNCASDKIQQFNKTLAQKFIKRFFELFDEQQEKDSRISLTINCKAKFAVNAFHLAIPTFKKMNQTYEKKYGSKTKMEEYKKELIGFFITKFTTTSDILVNVHLICSEIKRVVLIDIRKDASINIVKSIKAHFNHHKHDILVAVMTDLLHQGNFSDLANYVDNSKAYILKWMEKFLEKRVFVGKHAPDSYSKITTRRVDHVFQEISDAVADATKQYDDDSCSEQSQWIDRFCSCIQQSQLKIVTRKNFNFDCKTIMLKEDLGNMERSIDSMLDDIKHDIIKELSSTQMHDVNWVNANPCNDIVETVWGCSAQCPFCGEPCMVASSNDHEHDCVMHRPSGLSGWRNVRSKVMITDHCEFSVTGKKRFKCFRKDCASCGKNFDEDNAAYHFYSDYKTYFPKWHIRHLPTGIVEDYWKYMFVKYKDEIVNHHSTEKKKMKPPKIPKSWKKVNAEMAEKSIAKFLKTKQ